MQRSPVQLLVTVDTEEDDWWPTRVDVTAHNVFELPRLDEVLAKHGARPTYLVTYRVARNAGAARTLVELRDRSGAEIGAHLHPWNTPPQELSVAESVSLEQLPVTLQRSMLRSLTDAIEGATGSRPRSFRAGRRSVSPTVLRLLAEEGYLVDSSVVPYVQWHDVPGSPAYFHAPPRPYRVGGEGDVQTPDEDGVLVEVPATAGYSRAPWPRVARLDRLLRRRWIRPLHLHGILHRTGILQRLTLNPEQSDGQAMLTLALAALSQDVGVLNLYLHSSSLLPGCNEYVRTDGDRRALLRRVDEFLEGLSRLFPWYPVTLSEFGGNVGSEGGGDEDR